MDRKVQGTLLARVVMYWTYCWMTLLLLGMSFPMLPGAVEKLVDHEAVQFDDDGEPTNVEDLVKSVADEHPYLIQSDESRVRPVEHSRSNGPGPGEQKASESLLASRYGRFQEKAQT